MSMPELIRRGLDAPTWAEIKQEIRQLIGQGRHDAHLTQAKVDVGGLMVTPDEITAWSW